MVVIHLETFIHKHHTYNLKMFSISHFLFISLLLFASTRGFEFLNWGDKCEIPRVGGERFTSEECDAGKGLICTGQACECTYKQRYSYDHTSKECRRRPGKPCRFVDIETSEGRETLERLPFNLKCHADAECLQFEIPVERKWRKSPQSYPAGVTDIDKFSMCVCKEGF